MELKSNSECKGLINVGRKKNNWLPDRRNKLMCQILPPKKNIKNSQSTTIVDRLSPIFVKRNTPSSRWKTRRGKRKERLATRRNNNRSKKDETRTSDRSVSFATLFLCSAATPQLLEPLLQNLRCLWWCRGRVPDSAISLSYPRVRWREVKWGRMNMGVGRFV